MRFAHLSSQAEFGIQALCFPVAGLSEAKGFSSGGENPHGVRAVTRGQRCAVALWFTLDPLYRELVRKRVCL